MAFDFVNYINTTLAAQQPALLPDDHDEQKKNYTLHLTSAVLDSYIKQFDQDAFTAYQDLLQYPSPLTATAERHAHHIIEMNQSFKQLLLPISHSVDALIKAIAVQITSEVHQLDQTSALGALGIQELLHQQYENMQNQLQPWFWTAIGQPALASPATSIPHLSSTPDAQAINAQFNQLIHQKEHASLQSRSASEQHVDQSHSPLKHRKLTFLIVTIILIVLTLMMLSYAKF